MKKLQIIYIGGTGGTFLNFFFNKFSKLTSDRNYYPFNDLGTVYNTKEDYQSILCTNYHENFIDQNIDKKNLNVCPIFVNESIGFLYWELSCQIRAGQPLYNEDNLWKKTKEECSLIEKLKDTIYLLQNDYPPLKNHRKEKFSKKEIRDFKLQRWRAGEKYSVLFKQMQNFKNNSWFQKQNVHAFYIESYFEWDLFLNKIIYLDNVFNLALDFKREEEMKNLFQEYIKVDYCKQQILHIKEILKAINDNKIIEIKELNVECEAYLISFIEKTFMIKKQIPSNDSFFKNTKELIDLINC